MSSGSEGLVFYPKSHRYKLDGQWVPGVTTVIGVLEKPAIAKWAAKVVAEWVADNPDALENLRALGRNPMVYAIKELPWTQRDKAGDRGRTLHDYAERLLRDEPVEVADEFVPVIENALAFLEEWRIEPLLIEAPCGSRSGKWAGTLDLIAKFRHPVTLAEGVAIFDWKSGKAIYAEAAWQLNAYARAEFALVDVEKRTARGTEILVGREVEIPTCDAAFGVHIRADGFDVYPLAFGPEISQEFEVIRQTFEIAKRGRGDWKEPGSGYVGLAIQTGVSA